MFLTVGFNIDLSTGGPWACVDVCERYLGSVWSKSRIGFVATIAVHREERNFFGEGVSVCRMGCLGMGGTQ